MKKIINLVLIGTVILAALGCNKNSEENIWIEDTSGERIPVLGWCGITIPYNFVERYREMMDAGFTINYGWDLCHNPGYFNNPARHLDALDSAQAAGIKIFIASAVLDNFSADDVQRVKTHPALYGYALVDEPRSSEFDALAEQTRRVQAVDPDHVAYINLNPTYAFSTIEEYRTYVQDYVAKVPVPFISFDHYPVMVVNGAREVRASFYANLEIIADEARKANKPFWAFALSMPHGVYPTPTLADLHLQVYSDLAYGAQCIQYFTYFTATSVGNTAPINPKGEKTDIYSTVQTMNKEIKNLSKVFLNATVVWTAHTGEIPQGCRELDKSQLPAVFKSLEISEPGALVSLLKKGKDNFLVIVNHDINRDITVKISAADGVRRVKKDGSITEAGNGQSLNPGDAVIYFWK